MNDTSLAHLRRAARSVGLIGVGLALVGWIVVSLGDAGTSPGVTATTLRVVLLIFGNGLPAIGGVMVAVWIAVAVWIGRRNHRSELEKIDHGLAA